LCSQHGLLWNWLGILSKKRFNAKVFVSYFRGFKNWAGDLKDLMLDNDWFEHPRFAEDRKDQRVKEK